MKYIYYLFVFFQFVSCSTNLHKQGGAKSYTFDSSQYYSHQELEKLSGDVILSLNSPPPVGDRTLLLGANQRPLKRIGIIIFESLIQPTRSGLSGEDHIYPLPSGRQKMTESFYEIWIESLKLIAPQVDLVKLNSLTSAQSLRRYGSVEMDYILLDPLRLHSGDLSYIESGKKIPNQSLLSPRGMQDLSFLSVSAYELMGGPKWSEHHKHFVNEICKELKLDAALIIYSHLQWTSSRMEKNSHQMISEELKIQLKSSVLIPFHSYHERLDKLGIKNHPYVTLNFNSYETEMRIPLFLNSVKMNKDFSSIEDNLLTPLFKSYKDLSQMMIFRIKEDIEKTW